MKHLHFLSLASLLTAPGAFAAVLTGIADPAWDRTGNGFAAWEYFDITTGAFSGLAPDQTVAGSDLLTATLSQSVGTIGFSGSSSGTGADRLQTGPYDFTITGVATEPITTIQLQIKHSNFLDASWAEVPSPFTASLNDNAAITGEKHLNPDRANGGWAASDPNTSVFFWDYVYVWDGLDIAAGEEFTLSFSSGADELGFGFSLDTIALDVRSVPEPSSAALILLGSSGVFLRRRRAK